MLSGKIRPIAAHPGTADVTGATQRKAGQMKPADSPESCHAAVFVSRRQEKSTCGCKCFSGAPAETRTPDPLIKSQMLYQLSYRGNIHHSAFFQALHYISTYMGVCQGVFLKKCENRDLRETAAIREVRKGGESHRHKAQMVVKGGKTNAGPLPGKHGKERKNGSVPAIPDKKYTLQSGNVGLPIAFF